MTRISKKKTTGSVATLEKHAEERPQSRHPRVTKKAQLISLLSVDNGADVTSLCKKLGWLPHTTRAALTGLRKSGYEIQLVKPGDGKPSRYHITNAPVEQSV